MKPYFVDERSRITIYHGDCAEVMDSLDWFDLLLCDPPYGIDVNRKSGLGNPGVAKMRDYGKNDWDKEPVAAAVMDMARSLAKWQIIWGGNYYALPPCTGPLIWDKENTGDFADGELAWNNLGNALRIKRHMWNGMLRKGQEERFHPTQKPLDVILWALSQAPSDVATVLDPWMGSGTTLRACKDVGKSCVGIEIEERYCEIAARRLEQEVLAL